MTRFSEIMNCVKLTTSLAAVLRFTLPFCAIFLLAHSGMADITEYINEDGVLIIGDGETPTSVTLNDPIEGYDVEGIVIEAEGVLVIEPGTMVHLGSNYVHIKDGGTLKVSSSIGTGIYSGEFEDDGKGNIHLTETTNFYVDGGLIEIVAGDSDVLFADTINVMLGTSGGTLDVAADIIFESGGISGGQTGDVTKIGDGTWRVGSITMGGTFNIQEGTANFLNHVSVGKLTSEEGTIINGLQADGEGKSNLSIATGGYIKGTLKNVGYLLLGDGTSTSTLTFEGGLAHDIEGLGIARYTTLDIQDGTSIKLTSEDAKSSYDDMIVEGTLRVSSAFGTGIYKGNLATLDLDSVYITVAGSTDWNGNVIGGIVEIYKSSSSEDPEILFADTLNTRVIGIGKIIVESGVIFESGKIEWGESTTQSNVTGAHVIVSGGGTYRAADVNIGTGYFVVEDNGTTMEFLETITAGALISDTGTQVITHGNATFSAVNVAGNYEGNNCDLTLQYGGRVTGNITGVQNLTLGSDLLVSVDNTDTPTISTDTWTFSQPVSTRIRTIAGTDSGTYQKVFQVQDNTSRADLLAVLRASGTALYRPSWMENSDDGTYLDLQLSILSVNDYISGIWRKRGRNIENAGWLVENYSAKSSIIRERLESLSDSQFRDVLRNVMVGELAGNAIRLAMQQPAHTVFRHLDGVVPLRSPFTTRGQVREGFNVWFNPFVQAEHAKNDATTFDGYDLSRYGFHLGGDIEIYNRAVSGVFFGYTGPNVKSDLGKVSANDYITGLYLRMPICQEMIANMMVGFGSQDYSYKNAICSSSFRGNSFFASAELSSPVSFQVYKLTPLVAVDFQSATMDAFAVYDPVLGCVLIEPENLSSTAIRIGLLSNYWRIRTRLQYMHQIAGKDFVSSRTALIGDLSAATQIRSTQWGKDWVNIGLGGELLTTQHWRIFADYNFVLGKQTTSHLGSFNTVLTW